MDYKVYFAFAVVSSSYGICPDVLRTDKNAALDFIMRASRMNFEDLVFIQFQKFWGLGDDAILEEAKEEKPLLYRKMVNFLERCNELSLGARKYMIEGFLMAMQHALFYHRENYYTTEQLSDAKCQTELIASFVWSLLFHFIHLAIAGGCGEVWGYSMSAKRALEKVWKAGVNRTASLAIHNRGDPLNIVFAEMGESYRAIGKKYNVSYPKWKTSPDCSTAVKRALCSHKIEMC
ncbi:hypothetical protein Y032_0002g718 [Ancylostoma ceylanicum]|uniref:Uncharacterized protein n=1 Tax=Ancylostoma ceylanicum TaxID=53326 RepID=A0A016W1Z0_9BILA|nr:hypothetical protein Y032_0002g718 [Ancylostoma ceylanicum]